MELAAEGDRARNQNVLATEGWNEAGSGGRREDGSKTKAPTSETPRESINQWAAKRPLGKSPTAELDAVFAALAEKAHRRKAERARNKACRKR
jgi:hypothetical protein